MSDAAVVIRYGSEYAARITDGSWKPTTNIALAAAARRVHGEVSATRRLAFSHVKGHSGHRWNGKADQLANLGATGARCDE
jgi:ribonuclease HI